MPVKIGGANLTEQQQKLRRIMARDECACGDCGTACEPVIVLASMSKRLADIPEIAPSRLPML